ncbi:response regulator [Streptomyces sp. JNUCC 64]
MKAEAPGDDRAGILLVDDMEDNLTALEAVLGPLDEPLVRARSGEEALRAVRRRSFAVVLLDVHMPGMDGFETAAQIRRLHPAGEVPIVFLTASDPDSGFAFRGYATGAADYLTKPFDPWVLRAKVTVFLDLHRKNRLLERLLAREERQFDELADRLAVIERRMAQAPSCRDHTATDLRAEIGDLGRALREMRRDRVAH